MPPPVSRLWVALTDPDRLAQWFSVVTGNLRQGGRFVILGNASGSILTCSVQQAVRRICDSGAQAGLLDLRVAAQDFAPDKTLAAFGPGALGIGWEWSLMELARHLDWQAPRLDKDDFAVTPEGKVFARASSDLWGQAAISDGPTPPRRCKKRG